MNIKAAMRTAHGHLRGHYRRPLPSEFSQPLRGARGLEIGGPSSVFGSSGLLPVYPLMQSVDGVQPSASTYWHDLDARDGYVIDGERRGRLYLQSDLDLPFASDGAYDAVLSSHVLEHIANPLRALGEWRRVTRQEGYLLMVVPHMEGTFDHRRPLTELPHIIADMENGTTEDDLTHLDEFVALHDSARNGAWTRGPEFVPRLRDNLHTRLLHHHTFTTHSVVQLLEHAGLQVLAVEARLPHDVYVLGRWSSAVSGDEKLVSAMRRSPFRIDRRQARERQTV